MEDVIDLIATDASASDISDKIDNIFHEINRIGIFFIYISANTRPSRRKLG
jgi:hypothetical protein